MDSEKENNIENVPPAYILLPVCVECKEDVFLSVVRAIIGRSVVDKNPSISSMINGMNVRTLKIEAEDIGAWNNLNSQSQQMRQAVMLGYWCIRNFPSLGNKLCGNKWKAPQRRCVQIVGRESMIPEEFDSFIVAKMKLRIIELRVYQSTLERMKEFIRAPTNIGKVNRIQLYKKMFSLDIENGFHNQCWNAMRSGVLSCSNVSLLVDSLL